MRARLLNWLQWSRGPAAPMPMAGDSSGAPSMAGRPCGRAPPMTGRPASRCASRLFSRERPRENLKILGANGHGYDAARTSISKDGPALPQGWAVCGQRGRHVRVRCAGRRGRQDAWCICDRARSYRAEPLCQSIAGPPVDDAIGRLLAEQTGRPPSIWRAPSARRSKPAMKTRTGGAGARPDGR